MTFVAEEDDASVSEVAVERWSQSIKADCWETRSVHLQLHYKSCVSLVDSRQSTQQQEQCAGSPRVKILYPKHTV
jgi:hypothetical protein